MSDLARCKGIRPADHSAFRGDPTSPVPLRAAHVKISLGPNPTAALAGARAHAQLS